MADRSSKKPTPPRSPADAPPPPARDGGTKDLHAVSLGRRGGLVGGRARADSLSPERRSEIARRAAAARWEQRAGDAIEIDDGHKDRRGRLNERLRQAFIAGAEEHSRQSAGRSLNMRELGNLLGSYPGDLDPGDPNPHDDG